MKKILFLISTIITLGVGSDECERLLSKSIIVTETCLNELNLKTLVVKNVHNEKKLQTVNKQLIAKNVKLSLENEKLRRKLYLKISKKNKKINRGLIGKKSIKLRKKYLNEDRVFLLKNRIYKVPSYMANIREGYSKSFSITNVVTKGQFIEFSEFNERNVDSKRILWIKTMDGWLYIPSKQDVEIISKLKNTNLS